MRITVAIEDELHTAAMLAARRRGYTLGRLIEDALRRELAQNGGVRPPELPVFMGGAGRRPALDLRTSPMVEVVER